MIELSGEGWGTNDDVDSIHIKGMVPLDPQIFKNYGVKPNSLLLTRVDINEKTRDE